MYKRRTKRNVFSDMTPGKLPDVSSMVSTPGDSENFFQFEPAVVLDVILDESHPYISNSIQNISPASTPPQWDDSPHDQKKDLSYIGHIKARMLYSEKGASAESLRWAAPLNPHTAEIPLLNEIVHLVDIRGKLYYTNRINHESRLNFSGDFSAELYSSNGFGRPIDPESFSEPEEYVGPKIEITFEHKDSKKNYGVGGRYFSFNKHIRRLKRFEGDTIIESRFGQSIRFGAYSDDREIDKGDTRYSDYSDKNGGNPWILIRNRQRPLTKSENEFYSTILEDINTDGSSIQITSGLTESGLDLFGTTHFKKRIFSNSQKEEQPNFSPSGTSSWNPPKLVGEQIVIFSDRVIIGSRSNEVLIFSKSRLGLKSDTETTIDSHEQIVITTNEKTVINSPFIYLGEYDQTKEPAVLGETMIEWLYDLGEWLKSHTHYYHHSHPDAGGANPNKTQTPVQIAELENLIQRLPLTLSKRVFLTGGGYAPGRDGGKL